MEDTILSTFGDLLKTFRKHHKITQQALATQLGVHRNTIGVWENGGFLPDSKAIVLELARLLHLDTHDTRRLLEASLTALSPYWLIPYQRNPFFTGRDPVLQQLHTALSHERSALISQSYALSGLGGIGKTQTAIEYAYRYANDYTGVFWISAETNESIVSSFVAIAELLNLPEKQEKKQKRIMAAVIRWFTSHNGWLLIFDNVEDLELVKSVLPSARSGSLLFTSRRQTLGFTTQTLDLDQMTPEEGMRFLLHRARLLAPTASLDSLTSEDTALARQIVTAMAGLPLALDQAGAYIEATQCSLSDYLQLFQSSQLRLLDERDAYADHPSSVARTFALAFEQLEHSNPVAAELLTVCAFLAPEAIPETFFIEGAQQLGAGFEQLATDPLEFQRTIKALLAYSLLQRNAMAKTVTMHRLVQAVLKGSLSETVQDIWIARTIRAMVQIFPQETGKTDYAQICEKLLPHALMCIADCDQGTKNEEASITLMSHVATYLSYRAQFAEAEPLYQRALYIGEQVLGQRHSLVAEVLRGLGILYKRQGKYEQAKEFYERSLYIQEQMLGVEHPQIIPSLNNLAVLYSEKGKYAQAEVLYKRSLRIGEQELGPEHPDLFPTLNNLGVIYKEQARYEQAQRLYLRALRIKEQLPWPNHAHISSIINNLGELYRVQGKYEQAESFLQRALHNWEQTLGPEHPDVAYAVNNLAELYFEQGKYEQAESLHQRTLQILERVLEQERPQLAYPLLGLAGVYTEQGKYEQAERLFRRALHIREQTLGHEHPELVIPLQGLAQLYIKQGKYEEAELLFERALALRQQCFDPQHPYVADTLHRLAQLRHAQQRASEALSLYQQALTIREKALGLNNPKTNATRTAYTNLLRELGREEEAMVIENQVVEAVIEP